MLEAMDDLAYAALQKLKMGDYRKVFRFTKMILVRAVCRE